MENTSERARLVRTIRLPHLIGIEIGQTIGAGVFALTGIALARTGPSIPLAFLAAAVPVTISMLVLGMFGSAEPISGGTYVYGARYFSRVASFTGVWAYIIGAFLGLFPLFALTGANFIAAVFPAIPKLPVALALLFLFYLGNLLGAKIAMWVQAALVVIMLSALALFIALGIPDIRMENFTPFFGGGAGGFAVAASVLTFTILGSNAAVELGDEIKDPSRNIPRSFFITIPAVTVMYVLLGLVAGGIRKWGGAEVDSLAGIAGMFLSGFPLFYFILGGGLLAVVTTLNATFLWGTKSLIMIAEDGLLPQGLARINRRFGTPHWLLTIIFCVSAAALLAAGERVETFAIFASIGGIIIFIPVMGGALRFRSMNPEGYRRSRLKLKGAFYYIAPVTGLLLALIIIVILLVDLSTHESGMLFLSVFIAWTIGGAVYAWLRLRAR
ncbi:MAG: amino acid permease, partial [Spirochaetales bacterium]|nr:amino acid permease [Spirochaetales bacterium]